MHSCGHMSWRLFLSEYEASSTCLLGPVLTTSNDQIASCPQNSILRFHSPLLAYYKILTFVLSSRSTSSNKKARRGCRCQVETQCSRSLTRVPQRNALSDRCCNRLGSINLPYLLLVTLGCREADQEGMSLRQGKVMIGGSRIRPRKARH